MKTRRILAASTAALLAFGATAVVAFAGSAGDKVDGKTNTLTIGSGSEVIVGGKVDDGDGGTEDFDYTGFDEDTLKGDLTTNLSVSLTLKNAKKIKGEAAIVGEFVETPEDDNEKVDIEELDIGVSDAVEKELAKVKASDVKIIKIKVGVNDKTASSIGCPVTVTVKETYKNANVYHVNDDGSLTKLDAKSEEGFTSDKYETTFTTNKFSPFIITTATLKASAASTDDSSAADSAATNDGTSTNPETGIALAIAPVVLAAGAVAVVALKKKH